jgi:peroxiredoxin
MELPRPMMVTVLFALFGWCVPSMVTVASDTTQPAVVSADARQLLDQIRDAYSGVKSLGIVGTIAGHFDIDNEKKESTGTFNGLYDAGKFRNEMKDDAIVGDTGDTVYLFVPNANKYESHPTTQPATLDSIPAEIADIVRVQDLSLALALSGDASAELLNGTSAAAMTDSVKIDGVTYPAILLTQETQDVTLAVDPQTHLLRRETVDLTKLAKSRGAQVVKIAEFVIDFSHTPGIVPAADAFAWTPPPGATMIDNSQPVSPLTGKPVPSFSATEMDGTQISSDSLKGTPYVLDFWATWCGPCIASLPHVDQLYQQMKGTDLKVIAVNVGDTRDVVAKFVQDQKLTLPVALDPDSKMSEPFGATDTIPLTVIVGRDGIVRKVFIGVTINTADEVQKEAQAALDAK